MGDQTLVCMPWAETNAMNERSKFVLEWEKRCAAGQGRVDVAELCRISGVSRPTGYKWISRYVDAGRDLQAMADRPRRPHTSPTAVSEELEDLVVLARKQHPRWGPRKLRAWLEGGQPQHSWPAASTIGDILKRRGLTTPRRRRRRRTPPVTQPLAEATAPNAVWCIDFKGQFRTGDGQLCYPLTLSDAYSRYLLRCELVEAPTVEAVEYVLDSAFREFGRPVAIRSDNGSPFASKGAGGLTRLSVRLIRLDIRLDRSRPGKPQDNGRHERIHLTLKQETASPPQATWRAQQRAFDLFRREYNEERPHEALGQKPPASVYVPSTRRYPCALLPIEPTLFGHVCPVDRQGCIRWHRRKVFITSALWGERVEVAHLDDSRWEVHFGPVYLGHLDDDHPDRGLILPRRPRKPELF